MMLYGRRGKFDAYMERIGKILSRIGLTPNQWTILSLVVALAGFYSIINQEFITAGFLFSLSFLLDLIDGAVARAAGKATKIGAYLDTIVDRYVEFLLLFGLVFLELPPFIFSTKAWILLLLFGSLMTTYSKAAASEKGLISGELKGGLIERAERSLLLIASLFLASLNTLYLTYMIALLAGLVNISAIQRFFKALGGGGCV
ncbi:MAG: CDP-alcohol phosphatidyltransferase family protein [Candidatus Aenigmatarchaeota archaeon]|nr:MAG: CDP-alcohol phosphatidyltransferase family protein [Candidatus Aenigmarchaeota archaeon]